MKFVLFALGLAACGHKTAAQACADLANARCNKINACSNGNGVARQFASMNACLTREAAQCMVTLSAPDTALTPDDKDNCGATITAQSCSEFRAEIVAPGCLPPPGKLANGAACATDAECASIVCRKPVTSECGTCAAQPVDGDSCADLADCGRQLQCVGATTCRVPGQNGAGCDADHPCAGGFSCVTPDASTAAGSCRALAEVGMTCDPQSVGEPACDNLAGVLCDPNTRQCVGAQLAAPDAVCGAGELCGQGALCQPATAVATGADRVCIGASPEGAACDTVNGPLCMPLARCVPTAASGTQGICAVASVTACGG